MTVSPLASAAPLRPAGFSTPELPTVDALVAALRPDLPVYCLRPDVIAAAARQFAAAFPGPVMYAVKCNPEPLVLDALAAGGITRFDVASPAEVAAVCRRLPAAELNFMHPVKSRSAIREAHGRYGVRSFALDSAAELEKITAETGAAPDLTLIVRLAVPPGRAVCDLSGKFGAAPDAAADLLRMARGRAARLGVSFHVGSQCADPQAYAAAMGLAGQVIRQAAVPVEVVDVGGGFPADYPGAPVPPLADFFQVVRAARRELPSGVALWAEPGRALVAAGGSLVVRIVLRRGSFLYINDGVFGGLHDAGPLAMRFPARLIRPGGAAGGRLQPFHLFGPTCDSADVMPGPFLLPEDAGEGDWIEIGQLGAYGSALRTGFNGFGEALIAQVRGDTRPE